MQCSSENTVCFSYLKKGTYHLKGRKMAVRYLFIITHFLENLYVKERESGIEVITIASTKLKPSILLANAHSITIASLY